MFVYTRISFLDGFINVHKILNATFYKQYTKNLLQLDILACGDNTIPQIQMLLICSFFLFNLPSGFVKYRFISNISTGLY